MSLSPKELHDVRDDPKGSRALRQRVWENLQEIRLVLKGTAGVELPLPARKTIDLEGRIVKYGVRETLKDRQLRPFNTGMKSALLQRIAG